MEPGAAGSFPTDAIDQPSAEAIDGTSADAIDEAEEIATSDGGCSGRTHGPIHGPTLLRALLTAQPQIHLFAVDGGGLTLTPTPNPQPLTPTPNPQPQHPIPNTQHPIPTPNPQA